MPDQAPALDTIFAAAIEIATADERAAYIAAACADDSTLRQRVERLVAAHFGAGRFLEPEASRPALDEPPAERLGMTIGPYKLLQVIGEGGMGVVWMAEQAEPVQRKVALKIIRPDLDSRQVLARFEAERQALALMDHPNIAKVFEAGATPEGRPYFVMELVKGLPITRYCDEHRLTPRQRLELFVDVCHAVQHAHQKGIIHRDIKPSNVLVAPYDGRPVVKVIDFGVAKAAGPRLTEKTLFTEFGAIVGTLEYMSPEQAELNNQDIDTRSDIYSLGVLLYELLTGSTPLDRKRLKNAAFVELLRVIREEEPPKPSTRLSTTEELPSISAQRQTEPARLTKLVRGELDWIVMKALDKERARRYETPGALATDLQRYLADEPVLACPPGAGYRLRKFIRRNRGPVAAGVGFAVLLLTAVAVSSWLAVAARRAETDARAAEQAAVREKNDKEQARLAEVEQRRRARQAVDDMYTQVAEKWLAEQPRLEKVQREFLEKALSYYKDFALGDSTDPEERIGMAMALYRVASTERRLGRRPDAEKSCLQALTVFEALAAGSGADIRSRKGLLLCHIQLGGMLYEQDDLAGSENAYRRGVRAGLALREDFPDQPDYWRDLAVCYTGLGLALARANQLDKAEQAYRAALEVEGRQPAPQSDEPLAVRALAGTHRGLGNLQYARRQYADAEASFRRSITLLKKLADESPSLRTYQEELTMGRNNLAMVLRDANRVPEAIELQRETVESLRSLARDFPAVPQYKRSLAACQMNLAIMLKAAGHRDKVEELYREATATAEALVAQVKTVPEYRQLLANCHFNLGNLFRETSRLPAAEQAYDRALPIFADLTKQYPNVPVFRNELVKVHFLRAKLFDAAGRTREAQQACREALKTDPNHAEVKVILARSLATCADASLRNVPEALALARQATDQAKQNGEAWLTLGMAEYRAGHWKESLAALEQFVKLRQGNPGAGWFFLSMAHWKNGDAEGARTRFKQAVEWMENNGPGDKELARFRAEAAALLNITDKPAPKGKDLNSK